MAEDQSLTDRINELVQEEHSLRERLQHGEISPGEERLRLRHVEIELDRCWDLLRQRRARRDVGEDPEAAHERPSDVVENYLN